MYENLKELKIFLYRLYSSSIYMDKYSSKYLKYKNKYLNSLKQLGGSSSNNDALYAALGKCQLEKELLTTELNRVKAEHQALKQNCDSLIREKAAREASERDAADRARREERAYNLRTYGHEYSINPLSR